MFDFKEYVAQKTITNEEALKFIRSNDIISFGMGASTPHDFLVALEQLKGKVTNVALFCGILLKPYKIFIDPSFKDTFRVESLFFSPVVRYTAAQKRAEYYPTHLHKAWRILKPYRIYINTFSMPDEHGYISYGMGATADIEMAEKSDIVIAVINPKFPRLFGDATVHVSKINYFIHADYEPATLADEPLTEQDIKIGQFVANLVEDDSTIQLGIGAIPNAAALALTNKKNLGVHTEMLTDTIVDLYKAGVISGTKKGLHTGQIVTSFTMGSKKLYDFIDNNPVVLHYRSKYTNDPHIVGLNHKMVSINTTLFVDFHGQCASEAIGTLQISGTGGQFDTASGAQFSPGGKSIIAFKSTSTRKNGNGEIIEESKIVPYFPLGTPVTLSRNEVDYVVTEYGAVRLIGLSVQQRTAALISIANPKFREELTKEAKRLGFLF